MSTKWKTTNLPHGVHSVNGLVTEIGHKCYSLSLKCPRTHDEPTSCIETGKEDDVRKEKEVMATLGSSERTRKRAGVWQKFLKIFTGKKRRSGEEDEVKRQNAGHICCTFSDKGVFSQNEDVAVVAFS